MPHRELSVIAHPIAAQFLHYPLNDDQVNDGIIHALRVRWLVQHPVDGIIGGHGTTPTYFSDVGF